MRRRELFRLRHLYAVRPPWYRYRYPPWLVANVRVYHVHVDLLASRPTTHEDKPDSSSFSCPSKLW